MRHGHDEGHAGRSLGTAAALVILLLLGLGGAARADELEVRPPGPTAASGATWLGRVLALVRLPQTLARRDAARAALAAIGTQTRADPAPYRQAQALAQACLDGAPSPAEVDLAFVGSARGVSIGQLLDECAILRAQAASDAERVAAQAALRAQEIRPLLRGDRLKIFDAEGEPDCAKCSGDAKLIARAPEWRYVRGPSGPLATYETLTFVFRGDKLIERRQRLAHEQP